MKKRDRSRVGIVIEKTRDDLPKSKRQKSRKTRASHGAYLFCVANADQTRSKAHESRKPSTRSGVYTDVHEQHAHRLTKKKHSEIAVLGCAS